MLSEQYHNLGSPIPVLPSKGEELHGTNMLQIMTSLNEGGAGTNKNF